MKKKPTDPAIIAAREMAPGLYRLTKTIANPAPDRRVSRDWREQPQWPEGTDFYVTEANEDGDKFLGSPGQFDFELPILDFKNATTKKVVAVTANLEPVDHTQNVELSARHRALVRRGGHFNDFRGALQVLVDTGAITLREVMLALEVAEARAKD